MSVPLTTPGPLPSRTQEVIVRDDIFVIRETFERSAGSQEALLKELMGDSVNFLPCVMPPLQPFCIATYFGAYADNRMMIATELDYFPINGVGLAPAVINCEVSKDRYNHIYCPMDATERYFRDRYGCKDLKEFMEVKNVHFPNDQNVVKWKLPGLRMFLLASFSNETNQKIRYMQLIGIDKDKGLVCPGLPNVFGDTKVCMGSDEWNVLRTPNGSIIRDPVKAMQNALKSFLLTPANADIDSRYAYKALIFDKEGAPLDTREECKQYILPETSNELVNSFYKFITAQNL
tara:strand:+ start:737 stop:1606 length:870 start_codon:yes stop_codon:yes gene_type:complete